MEPLSLSSTKKMSEGDSWVKTSLSVSGPEPASFLVNSLRKLFATNELSSILATSRRK